MPQYDDNSSSSLSQVHCFITTHDKDGKAIFHDPPSGTEEVHSKRIGPAAFNVHYTTSSVPVKLAGDQDLKQFYEQPRPIPIALKDGTVVRMVDLAPGEQSPMHRTNSVDYGVVLAGEAVLVLEDFEVGPRRTLKVGDVSIQRGTLHSWRNPNPTEWLRMLYVLLDAEVPNAGEEDWGGIELPK